MPRKYSGPLQSGKRSAYVKGTRRNRKIMPNYSTRVSASGRGGVIKPQNNVPKQSVISLRYKQTIDITNLPVYVAAGVEQSGMGLVVNMSDPLSTGLIQHSFGTNTQAGGIQKSNSSTTGGQDNLRQALIDSGMSDKYDHFYVKKSVCHIIIRAEPNQFKLGHWLQTQTDANDVKYLQDKYPSLIGQLYNFAVMSDRASVNLVDETVLKVRHQTAGIKMKQSKVYPENAGKNCSFKLTYTPRRLGIKDPGDNRGLIGFTIGTDPKDRVQENSFAQFVIGKQMFPVTGKNSANSLIDMSIDYEIVCCERRITNNDAVPRPLPGRVKADL